MKDKIKQLRIRIDGLAQLTRGLILTNPSFSAIGEYIPGERRPISKKDYWNKSKELEKSYDSLLLAKAWLGKILGELGTETPYKNDGKRKTVEDIEEATDINKESVFGDEVDNTPFRDKNHIEKVDWLRQEIKYIADTILEMEQGKLNSRIWTEYMHELKMFCYQYISEARFWLGFELQRIRENKDI